MVFVVIPAYNEDYTQLRQTLSGLLAFHYEIVLVDDGSIPSLKVALLDLPIHYLRHSINLGQGAALQTGTEYALTHSPEYVVHFDADGQHSAKSINHMIEALRDGRYDIILGSRFIDRESSTNIPSLRKFILKGATIVNYLFTGIKLSDAHNGLRALTYGAAKRIHFTENRFAHATELLSEIKRHQLRYKEVPVEISYSSYSLNKGQKNYNLFTILIDLILNKLFKKS